MSAEHNDVLFACSLGREGVYLAFDNLQAGLDELLSKGWGWVDTGDQQILFDVQ